MLLLTCSSVSKTFPPSVENRTDLEFMFSRLLALKKKKKAVYTLRPTLERDARLSEAAVAGGYSHPKLGSCFFGKLGLLSAR